MEDRHGNELKIGDTIQYQLVVGCREVNRVGEITGFGLGSFGEGIAWMDEGLYSLDEEVLRSSERIIE